MTDDSPLPEEFEVLRKSCKMAGPEYNEYWRLVAGSLLWVQGYKEKSKLELEKHPQDVEDAEGTRLRHTRLISRFGPAEKRFWRRNRSEIFAALVAARGGNSDLGDEMDINREPGTGRLTYEDAPNQSEDVNDKKHDLGVRARKLADEVGRLESQLKNSIAENPSGADMQEDTLTPGLKLTKRAKWRQSKRRKRLEEAREEWREVESEYQRIIQQLETMHAAEEEQVAEGKAQKTEQAKKLKELETRRHQLLAEKRDVLRKLQEVDESTATARKRQQEARDEKESDEDLDDILKVAVKLVEAKKNFENRIINLTEAAIRSEQQGNRRQNRVANRNNAPVVPRGGRAKLPLLNLIPQQEERRKPANNGLEELIATSGQGLGSTMGSPVKARKESVLTVPSPKQAAPQQSADVSSLEELMAASGQRLGSTSKSSAKARKESIPVQSPPNQATPQHNVDVAVSPPSQKLSRQKDGLHLKVPASGKIQIDKDLTLSLNAGTASLREQIIHMQARLRESFPRIDQAPFTVEENKNRKTLQSWLKVLITRWEARSLSSIGTGKTDAELQNFLDQMVRDHNLSNESAKRMAEKWKRIFEARQASGTEDSGYQLIGNDEQSLELAEEKPSEVAEKSSKDKKESGDLEHVVETQATVTEDSLDAFDEEEWEVGGMSFLRADDTYSETDAPEDSMETTLVGTNTDIDALEENTETVSIGTTTESDPEDSMKTASISTTTESETPEESTQTASIGTTIESKAPEASMGTTSIGTTTETDAPQESTKAAPISTTTTEVDAPEDSIGTTSIATTTEIDAPEEGMKTASIDKTTESKIPKESTKAASISTTTKKQSTSSLALLSRRLYSTFSRPPLDPALAPESEESRAPPAAATAAASPAPHLPHLTASGSAHMVSVSAKAHTVRTAIAVGTVYFTNPIPFNLIRNNTLKKGDVLSVSRIAGIMAAKKCPDLVPLCHPIALTSVGVELQVFSASEAGDSYGGVHIEARVSCTGPTGVEMEALTSVMGAALSVVDMCKAVDRFQRIGDVRVVLKEGGKSGVWMEEGWTSVVHKDDAEG